MGDLSPHFDRSEFRCKHCGALRGPSVRLVDSLERLRRIIGRPIVVLSGYRCPLHNAAVGGAARSRHLKGDAADISSRLNVTPSMALAAGFTGIGRTRSGRVVHVDTRPGRPVIFDD